MTDQQFQDMVLRLEGSLSNLGAKQDVATQQLSQQLESLINTVNTSTSPSNAAKNASILVDTLNRNFNFSAMQPPERPDQISQNQVYIAGFTPAAASVLSSAGGTTAVGDMRTNQVEDLISRLPLVGPVFNTLKSITSFLMSPANLVTLGGMGFAFMALKRFFDNKTNSDFFSKGFDDMYNILTDTIGKVIKFFGGDLGTDPGATVRAKIEEIKENIGESITNFFTDENGFWYKYVWGGPESLQMAFVDQWKALTQPIKDKLGITEFKEIGDKLAIMMTGFKKLSGVGAVLEVEIKDLNKGIQSITAGISLVIENTLKNIDSLVNIYKDPQNLGSAMGVSLSTAAEGMYIDTDKLSKQFFEKIEPSSIKEILGTAIKEAGLGAVDIIKITKEIAGMKGRSGSSEGVVTAINEQTTRLETAIQGSSLGTNVINNNTRRNDNKSVPQPQPSAVIPGVGEIQTL